MAKGKELISKSSEISPYDPMYPSYLISEGVKGAFESAQRTAEEVYRTVIKEMPMAAQIAKTMKSGCRYVVDMSEGTMKALADGAIKLTEENGKTYAQLKINGKYGEKLPIKKEIFDNGIDPVQIATALQMQAIQSQIEELSQQLIIIDGTVREVLQGQQNDRIGLYYSGLSLFIESRNMSDSELKKSLQAQALRALTEATFQLRLTMNSDIQYLVNREYEGAKGNRKNLITSHIKKINESFAYIHQATMLRAGIYCSDGEYAAMGNVLNEYSYFITKDIKKNAPVIAQYDVCDDGTSEGLWESRARLNLKTQAISEMLNNPSRTYYIDYVEAI